MLPVAFQSTIVKPLALGLGLGDIARVYFNGEYFFTKFLLSTGNMKILNPLKQLHFSLWDAYLKFPATTYYYDFNFRIFFAQVLIFELEDDPFEVKLEENYLVGFALSH